MRLQLDSLTLASEAANSLLLRKGALLAAARSAPGGSLAFVTAALRPKGLVDDQKVAISEAVLCSKELRDRLRALGYERDALVLEVRTRVETKPSNRTE